MTFEQAYQEARNRCRWCKKGLVFLDSQPTVHFHARGDGSCCEKYKCTAPTREQFEEQVQAARVAAEERAEALERELAQVRKLETGNPRPRWHGDGPCEDCGAVNIAWFTPSQFWNQVDPDKGILCPTCFVKRASANGLNPTAWMLVPEEFNLGKSWADVESAEKRIVELRAALEPFTHCGEVYRLDPHVLVLGNLFSSAAIYGEHFIRAKEALAADDAAAKDKSNG